MDVSKIEVENNLHFRWTKYLFMFSNFLVVFAIALSWIIHHNIALSDSSDINPAEIYTPIGIVMPISIICWGLGFYFNNKDLPIIKNSVSKKYIKIYFISNIFYFIFIFITMISFIIFVGVIFQQLHALTELPSYGLVFGISAILSIVSIGLNRYSLYAMEFEIYKKRYGEKELKK